MSSIATKWEHNRRYATTRSYVTWSDIGAAECTNVTNGFCDWRGSETSREEQSHRNQVAAHFAYTHASPGCPLKYKAWLNHDSTVTGTHKLFNYTRNFVKSTFTHSFHSQYRTPYCTVQTEYWTATCRNYSLGHNHKQPGMCLGWHPASSARIEPSGPQVLLGHLKSCTEVYILIHNWYSNKPNKEFTSLPLKKHTPSASPDALESSTSCPASLLGPHLRNRTVKGT